MPVPKASRVTLIFERPSNTVSVAVRFVAESGRIPAVAMAPAAKPVLRKVRRVVGFILTSMAQAGRGEPDQWMLARIQGKCPRWIIRPAMESRLSRCVSTYCFGKSDQG